jgi:hypothetical protein
LALRQRKLLGVGVAFKIYYVMAWRAGQAGVPQSSLTRAVVISAMTTATAPGKFRHVAHRLTCKEWSDRHLTGRHMKRKSGNASAESTNWSWFNHSRSHGPRQKRRWPPAEAASRYGRAVTLAPQQKDYNDDHQYRAETSAIIMVGSAHIETTASKKENQNNQE